MARSWLSIRVDLIEGRGEELWPRPGRMMAAARTHTFADLATAIDDAFARWDRAHLHQFWLADGRRLATPSEWDAIDDEDEALDDRRLKLSALGPGDQFVYEFDFGDSWHHLCSVEDQRIDPMDALGIVPDRPMPFWGWGELPDQYGRRWADDDGEGEGEDEDSPPSNTRGSDLPAIGPWQWRRR